LLTRWQTFTGNLGGAAAEPVTASGDSQHPFEVDGDTFSTLEDAMTRSCDNQHNACADVANAGGDGLNGDAGGLTVGMCETQLSRLRFPFLRCVKEVRGGGRVIDGR
jgi:hypothetical protein